MSDLRKRALKSGKTVSAKARAREMSGAGSRASSAANSRAHSRQGSRNASRAPSDDEEGFLSDETAWSTNSIDETLSTADGEDIDALPDAWITELSSIVDQLLEPRKGSSKQNREKTLSIYAHILMRHFAKEHVDSKLGKVITALLRSIREEATEQETLLALKALAVTIVTSPSDVIYDSVYQQLKNAIRHSESGPVKTAAIHALGAATFYGGASADETEEIMSYLLEIVESDGRFVEAEDDADVVTAAIEEWGFLATQLEDLEELTEAAMEAFVEQLESNDTNVQIAAGENIALLFEKSYREADSDEEHSDHSDLDPYSDAPKSGPKMVPAYTVYRNMGRLKQTIGELAYTSSKSLSKKDRKSLHSNFVDILNSVNNPTKGPRYSMAIDDNTDRRFGSRLTVRIHRSGEMKIDQWWKLFRLRWLRRVLQGGFVAHYEKNEVVFDSLPIMIGPRYRK